MKMKHHSGLGKFVISIYFTSTCIENVFSFSTDKGKEVLVFLFFLVEKKTYIKFKIHQIRRFKKVTFVGNALSGNKL